MHVIEVRTLSVKSKPKRRGDRQRAHARLEEGDRADAPGESIPIFHGLAALD